MSNLQSYKLLENGEDPAAEPEELETSIPKGRRQLLESLQSVKTYFQFYQEQTQEVRKKLPAAIRPVCSLWPCLIILAAVVIAMITASVVFGAFERSGAAGEDVLQYIDPLIGTGPGGHVFAGAT